MNPALLEHATHTMAVGSKSFASAAKLFAPATRRSALLLYAWCRHCDDVVDGQVLGVAAASTDARTPQQRLAYLERQTRLAYTGAPMAEPAFAALQAVAKAHQIPLQLALDHLEGFAMDVRGEHYPRLHDTLRYCYHVAGVVGLMMAQVMGVREQAVLDRACDLGLAFQLTNMARDIVEDAEAGRCYLPRCWLAEAGIDPTRLADPTQRAALAQVAARLVSEAEPYYASALAGLPALPLRSAWAIASARGIYRKIGIKVRNAGAQAWDGRQRTSGLEKLGLLVRGAGVVVSARFATAPPRPPGLWPRPR
ncbi:15-cis-phytoene synthase CrtB [Pseudomonas typographi]|uniref:Phytoene/squalene synthase family protein n=1 Tax=Pseudomonas typographi TaxID=2715964 RepID=A0ABR7Z1D5_9PSED|nr:15-cis-phytoene synthase CrtB [Pseudomonas typographi]MBD1551669.1 phytoene/squalene synthase family protein [Pseudomonas typographi]MBD1587076.1 phytoene/squalene synthase family protein [Pseudomonas typographi]MBD1599314.1 phytoene/squalene synthase family protein [Pseudomonas typographi]